MITVIDGLTGSGKTYLMSRLLLKARKNGDNIYPNLALLFPNNNEGVFRWYDLSEIYHVNHGVVGIDEAQKYFGARYWKMLPITFANKIASHRHDQLDIITTTQNFQNLDVLVRRNVHERYKCQTVFRYPKNERLQPILQVIKITKLTKSLEEENKWITSSTRIKYISKFWTKELYNTYANIDLSHFICQIKREKKNWIINLTSRSIIDRR